MTLHRRPRDLVERLDGHSPTNAPWRARTQALLRPAPMPDRCRRVVSTNWKIHCQKVLAPASKATAPVASTRRTSSKQSREPDGCYPHIFYEKTGVLRPQQIARHLSQLNHCLTDQQHSHTLA